MNNYFLYKIDECAEGVIYGKFNTLSAAKLSASLLGIQESCFILSEDVKRIYFYNRSYGWEYDMLTDKGRLEFLSIYPNPDKYI